MKVKKVSKPTLECDTYLIAQAVNHNAEVLENALNRIEELEKRLNKEQEPFKNAYIQVVKERDIAIGQLNELGYSLGEKIRPCEKEQEATIDEVIAEINKQEEWLAQAGYNAYNVGVAFYAIKHALGKRGAE
jgi:uncharacterized protein YllA (UPF0747 family)